MVSVWSLQRASREADSLTLTLTLTLTRIPCIVNDKNTKTKVSGTDTASLGSSINPNASFWLGLDASETGTGLGVTQDISEFRHSIASLVESSARGRVGDDSSETTGLESPSRRINPDVGVLGKALDLCTDNEERFKMLSSRLRHIG